MPHSDDFGIDDDDTEFIAAATQIEGAHHDGFDTSPRPTKRRLIGRRLPEEDNLSDEVDILEEATYDASAEDASRQRRGATAEHQSRQQEDQGSDGSVEDDENYYLPGELDEEDKATRNTHYKIHIPKNGGQLPSMFFTQTQNGLDDNPSVFRGAVWKKPPPAQAMQASGRTALADVCRKTNDYANAVGRRQNSNTLNNFVLRDSNRAQVGSVNNAAQSVSSVRGNNATGSIPATTVKALSSMSKPGIPTTMDFAQDLEDLPSDAFSSSSPEKPTTQQIIEIGYQDDDVQTRSRGVRAPQTGLKQMTIYGQAATQALTTSQAANKKYTWPVAARDEAPTHHKLESKAMETWVYPINLGTVRDYQYNIVSRSLFHNTLVALPTGLGKTFIAATVMLNYYHWTTNAQVIFMAPTKPLIAQQMEACYGIAGIPRRDTVLMTGESSPAIRAEEWLERRVFFMTPQTVHNDLRSGICDPKRIVLVVVDEAHKATGNYAYTEVITFLRRFNNSFRVLALTATPGSTVEAVQSVIDHLGIARVELRTEQSLDIRPYTHEKHTETELFDFSDEQELIMEHISKALKPALDKLNTQNAYWSRDPMQLTAFGLTTARQKWSQSDAGRKAPMSVKGMLNSIFTVLSQIAHAIGLLKFHGIGPFFSHVNDFQRAVDTGQTKGKYATQICQSEGWVKATGFMRAWSNNPDFIGHPKLAYLREVVLNHFLDAGEGTRVMVFASYRDSTDEICRVLKRNEPMIRPHVFVGQAASKSSEGMDQKKQNAVVQDFKSGKYNTLVATSIGEEGLDIGDVDLIVCYDASASPIRMLQRIGRTGRKRVGRVVLLLMRGKEEKDYAKAQDNYTWIQKTIANPDKYTYRHEQSPRILPPDAKPLPDKRVVDIPVENSQPIDLNERNKKRKGKGKAKKPPKKFHMPDGVRTGFTKASRLNADSGSESDCQLTAKAKPGKSKKSASTKVVPRSPELEPAQLPFLEDVVLSNSQERDLARKYAYTNRLGEDAVIQPPDPSRLPDTFRRLGPTSFIQHGRATKALANALQAVHEIDDAEVARRKLSFETRSPMDGGLSQDRPVSPEADDMTDDAAVMELPVVKAEGPRGGKRKKQPPKRTASYGSAAMEGDESEPEPTPADMRIATQGIDLGSRDTSGEEEDEGPDSELEDFVVNSDQPIEMLSSSLPASSSIRTTNLRGGRRLQRKPARAPLDLSSDVDLEDDVEMSDGANTDKENAMTTKPDKGRKRRVLDDSDSDE